jgi:hypothetical protein
VPKNIFCSTLYGSTREQLNIIVFTHVVIQKTEQCSSLYFVYTDKKRTPHWSNIPFTCMRIKWCLRGMTHAARFDATLVVLLWPKIYQILAFENLKIGGLKYV